jgi:hypothetical protein
MRRLIATLSALCVIGVAGCAHTAGICDCYPWAYGCGGCCGNTGGAPTMYGCCAGGPAVPVSAIFVPAGPVAAPETIPVPKDAPKGKEAEVPMASIGEGPGF